MPALSRTFLVGFQAAALVATVSRISVPPLALAAPVPMPMPLMPHIADYASRPPRNNTTVITPVSDLSASPQENDVAVVKHTTSVAQRQVNDLTELAARFANCEALVATFVALANQAPPRPDGTGYNEQIVKALDDIMNSMQNVRLALGGASTDRGLGAYDHTNQLETLLKDLVNAVKDLLAALDVVISGIPVVGPILGPIVYEIKCILDGILDFTEDVSDSTLNAVQPSLASVISALTTLVCNLGLCTLPL